MTSRSNLSRDWKRKVIEHWGTTCCRCGTDINLDLPAGNRNSFTIDHYPIAHADGGPTTLDNLRPAHLRCNASAAEGPKTPAGPVHTRDW